MTRVAVSEVLAIIDTTRDVLPFITTASLLVDTTLADAGYTADLLAQIELWWTAHLIACAEPRVIEKTMLSTRTKLSAPKVGFGLEGTSYGQVVISLDSDGALTQDVGTKRTMFEVF
jgi:hypothetical protein